jgi:CheY-like chemotaxis protein
MEAVASILWETYCARQSPGPIDAPHGEQQDARPPTPTVDAELARVGLEAGEQSAVVDETVESVLALVGGPVEARGIRIALSLPETPIRVATSRTVLRQMLLSIFSFAAETAPGARLVLSATESGDGVLLCLLAEDRNLSAGGSEDADAMLESARQVAEAAGGALERGQVGQSHYVELRLPSARTTTVLIIDDDPDVARLLARYLAGTPYHPVHARTPPSALRLAQDVHPDVVILDVLMPAQDGWEILHELRNRPETSGIPIIMCSVLSEKPLARSLGADGYLSKPITRQSLLAALDRCCAGRDASGERRGSP